jgi:hypothetical protein
LNEQKVSSNHIVHLGRVLGSADLELLENEKSGTLDMGNWAVNTHNRAYSIKMPIKSLRRAAGFVLADGMHHNMRTTVEPDTEDEDLLDSVFPFVKGLFGGGVRGEERCNRSISISISPEYNGLLLGDVAALGARFPAGCNGDGGYV